jgi:hypothetical protein
VRTGQLIAHQPRYRIQHRIQRRIRNQHLQNPVTRALNLPAALQLFGAIAHRKFHLALPPRLRAPAYLPSGQNQRDPYYGQCGRNSQR